MQLFEVVRSTPVTFSEEVPASAALKQLLLGMLEKVGALLATLPSWANARRAKDYLHAQLHLQLLGWSSSSQRSMCGVD